MEQSKVAYANNLCCILTPYLGCTACDWVTCLDCRTLGPIAPHNLHARKCFGKVKLVGLPQITPDE